jgi:hypothetical protein
VIFFTTEHVLELYLLEELKCFLKLGFRFLFGSIAAFIKFVKRVEVVNMAGDLLVSSCPGFYLFNFFENFFGFF